MQLEGCQLNAAQQDFKLANLVAVLCGESSLWSYDWMCMACRLITSCCFSSDWMISLHPLIYIISFIRIVSQSRAWFPEQPFHLHITKGKTSLSWAMTALPPNVSVPGSTAVLLPAADSLFNLTAAAQAGLGSSQSLAPLCTLCCCGFLNRTLAVVFMVSLAFAIVVGNVVTLTVFVQTRQSRTPQGYLKGKCCLPSYH